MIEEPVVGIGRRENGAWEVVVGLPALSVALTPEQANSLAHQIHEKSLIAQNYNREFRSLRLSVIDGGGGGSKDSAPIERHLRPI